MAMVYFNFKHCALRIILKVVFICIYRFRVISHMNIFFTCKNTLVIMLQLYRLLILCLERRPVYRRQSRIFSMIPSGAFQEDSLANKEQQVNEKDEKSQQEQCANIVIVESQTCQTAEIKPIPQGSCQQGTEVTNETSKPQRPSRKNGVYGKKSSLKSR